MEGENIIPVNKMRFYGRLGYDELKKMSRKELSEYYASELTPFSYIEDVECCGCDVRQLIGSGNCQNGGDYFLCRKEKQTTLEEWL